MSEFMLPEKWCLRINYENRDIINDWRINIIKFREFEVDKRWLYIGSDGSGYKEIDDDKTPGNRIEITTEQFKEHVLGIITTQIIVNEDYSYLIELFKKLNIL